MDILTRRVESRATQRGVHPRVGPEVKMHKLTEIDITEKRRQFAKEREAEWQKIVRSALAKGKGNLMSGNALKQYIEGGFRYIDTILNSAYSVELDALIKANTLQPDEYFMSFKDKLFQLAEEEGGIVRSKALAQFQAMGDKFRTVIIGEAGRRITDLRESILNHTEMIKEKVKLELSYPATQEDNNKKEPLVFISYDTRDIDLANTISDIIKRIFNDRVKTFIAKRDIKPGEDAFKRMLHDSLAKSAVVLALCTRRSSTSPWLWFESGAGFGNGILIPIWAGIKPQAFKPPMTIFQGKNVEDREEVQAIISTIAEIVQIAIADSNLTNEEFDKLVEISRTLNKLSDTAPKARIEENIDFPITGPAGVLPVQYLIEARFPLSNSIPLQKLEDVLSKSKIQVKGTENKFSFQYPDFGKRINKNAGTEALILNVVSQQPFANVHKHIAFIKSDSITLTYWLRLFRDGANEQKIVEANEINNEGSILIQYFKKIALNLGLSKIKIRIRLFDLQNGLLLSDRFLKKAIQSYRAPESNELEIEQEISTNSSNQDIAELLMHVWDKFRTPDGSFPTFDEKNYLYILDNMIEKGS